MFSIVIFIHVILALLIIILVILQKGKGASIGAAFGSGSAGSVFGPRGATSALNKATYVIVFCFFVSSLTLSYLSTNQEAKKSVIEKTIPLGDDKTKELIKSDKPKLSE